VVARVYFFIPRDEIVPDSVVLYRRGAINFDELKLELNYNELVLSFGDSPSQDSYYKKVGNQYIGVTVDSFMRTGTL